MAAIAAATCFAGTAFAADTLTLAMPETAVQAAHRSEVFTSYRMPVGPFHDGTLPTRTSEGALDQSAWRIATPGLTTLQVLAPLREQIIQGGYSVLYECEAVDCGGFDFRYATDVLPEPEMHVDLGDYRYLAAERETAAGTETLSLMVSRSADQSFVQLTTIAPADVGDTIRIAAPQPATPPAPQVPAGASQGVGATLETLGAMPLDDLVFASGAATLEPGDYASLKELARWLQADAARRVALVGHTDASGGLEANMALSLRRAESVRAAMVDGLGAPAAQIVAQGAGPLAPRTGNQTPEGRERNRRVETVLLTTP